MRGESFFAQYSPSIILEYMVEKCRKLDLHGDLMNDEDNQYLEILQSLNRWNTEVGLLNHSCFRSL